MIIDEWQKNAKAGEWFVYYTGHLAPNTENSREAEAIGQAAYALYRTGWYELAQRRICHEPGIFDYLIIKRRQRDDTPRPGMVHDVRYYQYSKPRKEERV